MHPNHEIDKVYLAKVEGIIKKEEIDLLKKGVVVDGKKVSATRVKLKKFDPLKNTSFVEIVIHEGMNHQIKKMFDFIGFPVIKLTRKRVGIFDVDGLKSGEYRKLTLKEVQTVYGYSKK